MKHHHRLIYGFAVLKLLIHFLTNTNYGLHRDEYLYYDMGNHLSWGYMEVPPMVAFLAKLASFLGGSVFAIRLFPALIGAITIVLIGRLVKSLGGNTWAIIIACTAFIFSPAYLGSNTLFQPVSFNQFFWFLCAYFLIKIVQTHKATYWYYLGIACGLAFLTKYSILFYILSLVLGLLAGRQHKLLLTKHPYQAVVIALIIALPNLLWQYKMGFPVVDHMQELASSQLVNVQWTDYFFAQLLMQSSVTLIWAAGLTFLLINKRFAPYRFVAWALLVNVILILALSGKDYYTLGAYPILFVFGGLAWENWLKTAWSKILLLTFIFVFNLGTYPYVLPILKVAQMEKYCAYMSDRLGLTAPLLWENGAYYSLPQDYADMHGWDEMARKVSLIYHRLSDEEKAKCMIYGGNYGHAGAINYFRHKFDLPEAFSFNSSYQLWLPEHYSFDKQIQIEDNKQGPSEYFHKMILLDSVENRYARDPGYIYLKESPKVDVEKVWTELVKEVQR